jgi:carbamoyl-phosphate synthase large subunit
VLPFLKFKNVLPVLGPEMRSTGESMGIDPDPYLAYAKALLGANVKLPQTGTALVLGEGLADVKAELGALGFSVSTEAPGGEGEYALLIDTDHTPELRRALEAGVPYVTTPDAARWLVKALRALQEKPLSVHALQDLTAAPPVDRARVR